MRHAIPEGTKAGRACIFGDRGAARDTYDKGGPHRGNAMSQALQKTYDGIIIGAGHHGLVLGCYLAKAGLDVLLVDRRLNYGGGLNTTEATVPGFYHNLHSINHFHITETPWFADLGLTAR